jgi:hypothetical protein
MIASSVAPISAIRFRLLVRLFRFVTAAATVPTVSSMHFRVSQEENDYDYDPEQILR